MARRRLMWTGAIVVLLTLGSAIGAVALSPGGTFLDDDGNIHEGSIEAIAAIEVTKGCNPPANDLFCPNDPVTRGQMAAFLSRALDLPGSRDDYFIDDGDSVFESEIDRIALAGITKGCNPPTNDQYCPESLVTREVMAAFLVRAFGYTERTGGPDFVDTNGSIFAVDIDRLAAAGVTKGCNPPTNDRFCPNEPVTRAQMATFLTRALRLDPLQPPPRTVELDVVLREDWGAALANESLMAPHTIDTLTVHHAGDQTTTTGPERYRSWQAFHMSRGWGDVAYHYIIGVDGTVYEARDTAYAGDTGTNYDPSGHFLVVVEGNFDHDVPTERQLESLVNVLAWASVEFNVSPATIGGHRDHASTSCPGGNLYPFISSGDLEAAVRTVISGA